ncbi:alkanesulfonate monooxygenase SsuD/methylene tetrahydromethanopterin reductase-like flavin-dependent oxidoreductase (luciferase family) [Pseudonocardia sediminis]|uniref:Alkanesulfonate monooxygenase SsuD/methylene tetrahydromethanopterin reductase-like flavin-dependent oxidoreductase (Luciferase family) n=1 Tax=Pseudonocardia sediminis TaxID=1397368 RepID=A0A4Q7V1J3_PSEST|nr:LLM class flavin-dependent oxidoreductase [Pseudonocardia sediminis]RZT87191.1 alkanesulfonate monooxygenase SsuD/methylene tetrahydromethanopterin reductase-like flavin-dependent oxidoreductase (luciferase family) [Pseudonocardia sediminis]
MAAVEFGLAVHEQVLALGPKARRGLLARIADAGIERVCLGDHVSFHGGTGFDGLVAATAALATEDRLGALVGIYQAALRHPMTTARQLSSLAEMAPGRVVLGVGAGGEDRAEVANCGVDPSTRGARLDETLQVLRALGTGEQVDHDGRFFTLDAARILPAPTPAVPLVVGGASDAAIRRAARHGDGWLGIFCSARRFAATVQDVRAQAADLGRDVGWFGLQLWCGLDDDPAVARDLLAPRMESLYRLPYEKFSRVAPAGTPEQVAAFLAPFVEAGAGHVSLIPTARSPEAAVDHAAAVRELLLRS